MWNTPKTTVQIAEEVEQTHTKKSIKFLFFKMQRWELVNTKHVANDIHITTNQPIRDVYINGEILSTDLEVIQ